MALEAYLEASVVMVKGAVRFARWRTGFDKKRDLRVSNEVLHVGDQFQGRFLLVRSIRCWVILE